MNVALLEQILTEFCAWLTRFGEVSQDHQDYWNSRAGRWAKRLYYKHKLPGQAAVAPFVLMEAFLPSTRRWFWPAQRFPIADAHYAMGFSYLHQALGRQEYYQRARHFLEVLIETRCANYEDYGWGYPFDWQTLRGRSSSGTPLITTTPYVYEAFAAAHEIDGRERWLEIMQSAVRHVLTDIYDTEMSPTSSACSYSPRDERRDRCVINASAYRAWMLTHAAQKFDRDDCRQTAERNLNFVLEQQQEDGSWPYATDKQGQFIDNFHTCFVLKSLAKIEQATGHEGCRKALERGAEYYWERLLDEQGLPRPFAKAPRMTIYRYELYDFAECLNLAYLLRGRFSEFQKVQERVLDELLRRWRKPDGSFRTRKLLLGWNNAPMHRWGQAQLFRSLSQLLREERRTSENAKPADPS